MNNSAPRGSVLYGGLLNSFVDYNHFKGHTLGMDYFKSISKYQPGPLAISSDPVIVCLCTEALKFDCSQREIMLTKSRGEAIELIGVVVDQDKNIISSSIIADYSSTVTLGKGETTKKIDAKCTRLSYHIFTSNTSATIFLQPEGYCQHSSSSRIAVVVKVFCSSGFEEHNDECVCDRRLSDRFTDIVCHIQFEGGNQCG